MKFEKDEIGRISIEKGFVRDTYEKVLRLVEILEFLSSDSYLSQSLSLKGGTALNLTVFDLPRLSVDIDLDFALSKPKEEARKDREEIAKSIKRFMALEQYDFNPTKSKNRYALDSFVFSYVNTGGSKDNLKVEINYMDRCHILPLEKRPIIKTFGKFKILTVNREEIIAQKISALIERAAPRDLFDVFNIIESKNLLQSKELPFLKNMIAFYISVGGSGALPSDFDFSKIENLQFSKVKAGLLPVLQKGTRFDLKTMKAEVLSFLGSFLQKDASISDFWHLLKEGEYRPELLFSGQALKSIASHPMALWKTENARRNQKGQEMEM